MYYLYLYKKKKITELNIRWNFKLNNKFLTEHSKDDQRLKIKFKNNYLFKHF